MRNSIKLPMPPDAAWIIVAAYNEASALGPVLQGLLEAHPNVVVVDDASADDTARVAESFPVHVLRHRLNLGQGAALKTGIVYALSRGAEIVVTFDADGQMDPRDIDALCRPLLEGDADLVLGSRFLSGSGSRVPPLRGVLLRAGALATSLMTGLKLTDVHNGLRALNRRAAAGIDITHGRMAHASEIIHQAAALGLRVREVPVSIVYSTYSLKKGQNLFQLINVFWDLLFHRRGRTP